MASQLPPASPGRKALLMLAAVLALSFARGAQAQSLFGASANPCHAPGRAAGLDAAPNQAAYLAMATEASVAAARRLPPDAARTLQDTLARATNPAWGANVAMAFLARASGSAAIVAAAASAAKAPRDALVANNLGVALRGMKDYARAATALTYARSLSPGNPLIETNLGWLALGQGDTTAATGFFRSALSGKPDMASALAGQGLIAQCAGHPDQALPLFRASMLAGYSGLAAAGVNSAKAAMQASGTLNVDNVGSPQDDGPKGDAGPVEAYWPEAPFPATAVELAGMMAVGRDRAISLYIRQLEAAQARITADASVVVPDSGAGDDGGRTVVMPRGDDKALFVLRDLRDIFGLRLERLQDQFGEQHTAMLEEAASQTYTSTSRPRATALHIRYSPMAAAAWTALLKELGDMYGFSQPWLAKLRAPRHAAEVASLEQVALSHVAVRAGQLILWGAAIELLWAPFDTACNHPPPPAIRPGTLRPYKGDPAACSTPEVHMNFAVASLNADCEKMTLEFGEGVLVSGEYKFGKDWGDDTLTIFAGAGLSEGLGPFSAGLRSGAFISVQGGQVTDYGNQSGAGLSATAGPFSAGADAAIRLGGVSGLDVAVDGSTKIAVPGASDD